MWAGTTGTPSGPPGGIQATRDSSGLTYEGRDLLGTPIAALSLGSGVVNERLRTPYGQARLGVGSGMHMPYGFTGQREDTAPAGSGSGLDDFNARMCAERARWISILMVHHAHRGAEHAAG